MWTTKGSVSPTALSPLDPQSPNQVGSYGREAPIFEAVHVPGLLRVRVSDDGSGGARVEARGGLAGLADRVGTVDGRLQLSSPAGGPTMVAVELPSHA
jgi:hypothetical protein